jgi:hypothetical protein
VQDQRASPDGAAEVTTVEVRDRVVGMA